MEIYFHEIKFIVFRLLIVGVLTFIFAPQSFNAYAKEGGTLYCPPGQYCVDYICITVGPGTPTPGGGGDGAEL
ncbi:MAG: hypothetical protein DWB59_06360 [Anaerolineae bacterium]|nr:hypothetical protein [Anaerolineae bacterium]